MGKPVKLVVRALTAAVLCASALGAQAADTKVAIGISGWTGFAPLTLADKAGIFKKHGLDVDVKMIPQSSRHLAVASGTIQCAATTVETYISWNAAGCRSSRSFSWTNHTVPMASPPAVTSPASKI